MVILGGDVLRKHNDDDIPRNKAPQNRYSRGISEPYTALATSYVSHYCYHLLVSYYHFPNAIVQDMFVSSKSI